LQQWQVSKKAIKIGSIGPGDFTYEVPKIVGYALNLLMQVVAGYKGTAEIRLAVENGEVDGVCMDWNSVRSTWRKALDSGDVTVIVRITSTSDPEISRVPSAVDFTRKPEERKLIEVGVDDRGAIFRPYVLPPEVPLDRVKVLRRAFSDTLKDSDFLADAKRSHLNIDVVSGDELEKIVSGLFRLDSAVASKLSEGLR